jgi:hypothetical protein
MSEPEQPSLSQTLLDTADSYVKQAQALRTASAPYPEPNREADRLDARAEEMARQALALDVQNEAARVKAHFDKWVGLHKAHGDWKNEQTKSLISMSQYAIRLVLTINAGAAVALIAFLGNAVGKNASAVAELFARPLVVFGIGVTIAALVSVGSYVTQFLYGEDESTRAQSWAVRLHIGSLIGWILGLAVFVGGCFQTYDAMRSMAKSAVGNSVLLTQLPSNPPPIQVIYEGTAMTQTPRIPLKENAPPPKRPLPEPPPLPTPAKR